MISNLIFPQTFLEHQNLVIIQTTFTIAVIDNCVNNPCKNGKCINHPGGFTCKCKVGYTGKFCNQGNAF